jgi:RNA polymerase sigma factor (TIGR02999 family)
MVKAVKIRPKPRGTGPRAPLAAGVESGIPARTNDHTALLHAWGRGDRAALDRLIPLVHGELRRLASRHLRHERPGHTLQASALVNEAYLRLIDVSQVRWQNRAHFFAMASRIMRRILVDGARANGYRKRAGGLRVSLDEAGPVAVTPVHDVVALDDALNALEAIDPRKCQVVEMRFFGGMSLDETAEALHLSIGTVKRDWRLARAWLARELDAS